MFVILHHFDPLITSFLHSNSAPRRPKSADRNQVTSRKDELAEQKSGLKYIDVFPFEHG